MSCLLTGGLYNKLHTHQAFYYGQKGGHDPRDPRFGYASDMKYLVRLLKMCDCAYFARHQKYFVRINFDFNGINAAMKT